LKANFQGHSTAWYGMACVNERMLSLDGLWVTCPSSAFSGYHVDIHKSH